MPPNTCARCGSTKVIPDLPLVVQVLSHEGTAGGTADVYVQGAPKAWVFKDTVRGGLTAHVCGECGHVDLQVSNFRALYGKYEQARQS
jgi:hypothetical protein